MRLNQKTALTILLTALVVSVCFTAAASASERPLFFSDTQQIGNLKQLPVAVPLVIGAGLHGNSASPLEQPTRLEIYNYIEDNPGVHFRGICNGLGLSVGVVQYHLGVLEHAGLINAVTDGQNKRYFEHGAFKEADVELVSLMRHYTAAKILTMLAQDGSALHKDIAEGLRISSQALTWQMTQLKNAGLVQAEKMGVNVRYSLTDGNAEVILNLSRMQENSPKTSE
jgi:predicted transcriptional regulator